MTRRVLALVSVHVVLGAALLDLSADAEASVPLLALAALAAGYALVDLVPLHLEFRRNRHTITITEAVLVVAAFSLGPIGVVVMAVAGELVACAKNRLSPLQVLFNGAQTFGAASVAATVFTVVGTDDPTTARAWVAAFAGAACFAAVSMLSVAAVLTVAEGTSFRRIVGVTWASTAITALASAALGLVLLTLSLGSPWAPLLLAPVIALVVLESKRVTDASGERLRFQRLYEASSRTALLARVDEAVTVLADEARDLLTGTAAICCAQVEDGRWSGVIVTDAGPVALGPEAVDAFVTMCGDAAVELAHDQVPAVLRAALGADGDLVVAPSDPEAGPGVVLAVLLPASGQTSSGQKRERHLAEVLSAFMATASLAVGNARLYAEVEEALRHQVDLNRQKAEFVATVSHELRTPLASVLGSVQTIRRLGPRLTADDADALLGAALGQGARLRRLIEDLLLVAAAEHETVRGQRGVVEVAAVLGELRSQVSGLDGADRVVVADAHEVGLLVTDEDKLQRVLTNLVENALKYAPAGAVEVAASRDGTGTTFTVADRGPGIPPVDRDRIFERFVQLDQSSTRRQGGTGLGLHLCRNVVALLGGTLAVDDRADGGAGAVFSVRLPDVACDARTTSTPPLATPALASPHPPDHRLVAHGPT
jgi:signal transduction histidine kinase